MAIVIHRLGQQHAAPGQQGNAVGGGHILHHPPHRVANVPEESAGIQLIPGGGVQVVPVENPPHQLDAGDNLLPLRAEAHRTGALLLVVSSGANQLRPVAQSGLHQGLVGIRLQPVVAVGEGQIFSGGRFDSGIPGIAEAAVFLMNDTNAAVPACVVIAERTAAVRGAVIHQNDFQIWIGLTAKGVHALGQICLHLVNRDNDAEQRLLLHLVSTSRHGFVNAKQLPPVFLRVVGLPGMCLGPGSHLLRLLLLGKDLHNVLRQHIGGGGWV